MPDDLLESLSFALGSPPANAAQVPAPKNVTTEVAAEPPADEAASRPTVPAPAAIADEADAQQPDDDRADETEAQRSERRDRNDRRKTVDRRKADAADYDGPERRSTDRRTHAERRLGGVAGRRAQDHKAFQDRVDKGELTLEEVEFIRAIDRYKRRYERPFPTWSEILAIVKELGYTKDAF